MAKKDTVLAKVMRKSDGCTNSPDFNFYACCAEHDWYYSKNSDVSRFDADIQLLICIHNKEHPKKAILYFLMVRVFGKSHYKALGDKT